MLYVLTLKGHQLQVNKKAVKYLDLSFLFKRSLSYNFILLQYKRLQTMAVVYY